MQVLLICVANILRNKFLLIKTASLFFNGRTKGLMILILLDNVFCGFDLKSILIMRLKIFGIN
jgi:hypothetical protein